jgi:hypothetical protein
MTIHTEIAADFEHMLAEFGKPVQFLGRTLLAMISEPMLSGEIVLGGEVDDVRFTAKVLRSALPELPRSGQIVHWDQKDYRIKAVMNRSPHAIITLELGPANP